MLLTYLIARTEHTQFIASSLKNSVKKFLQFGGFVR